MLKFTFIYTHARTQCFGDHFLGKLGLTGYLPSDFYHVSYASTVLAVIMCLSDRPSVRHKSELYKDG